jgi:plasmid stabilization system protein ParE
MSPTVVVYLPEAQDDIDTAFADYERRRGGLGDRFLEALHDHIDLIQANPALSGVISQDVRAAPLRRFPHVVSYRAEPTQVVVVAVQHGRRDPSAWQGRI